MKLSLRVLLIVTGCFLSTLSFSQKVIELGFSYGVSGGLFKLDKTIGINKEASGRDGSLNNYRIRLKYHRNDTSRLCYHSGIGAVKEILHIETDVNLNSLNNVVHSYGDTGFVSLIRNSNWHLSVPVGISFKVVKPKQFLGLFYMPGLYLNAGADTRLVTNTAETLISMTSINDSNIEDALVGGQLSHIYSNLFKNFYTKGYVGMEFFLSGKDLNNTYLESGGGFSIGVDYSVYLTSPIETSVSNQGNILVYFSFSKSFD